MATENTKVSSKQALDELVELDYYMCGVDPEWNRHHLLFNYTPEQLIEFWWLEIGRHGVDDGEDTPV